MVDRNDDRRGRARGVHDLSAKPDVVEIVLRAIGGCVEDRAVALRARERQPPGDLREQRARHRPLGLHEVEVAEVQFPVRFRPERRSGCCDVDGARRRVLAEQRALRASQHLDALDVEKVERRSCRSCVEHAVDVHAHSRLDAVVGQPERRAEAANLHRRISRVGRVELNRRDLLLEAVHVEAPGVGHQRACDNRYRDRHLLRDLFHAPGRHHNRLRESRRRKRHIHCDRFPGSEQDQVFRSLEPIKRRRHPIAAGGKSRGLVTSLLIADGFNCHTSGVADNPDRCSRDGCPRRIANEAGDGSCGDLGIAGRRYERRKRGKCEHQEFPRHDTLPPHGAAP